jgi:hypothetical protein
MGSTEARIPFSAPFLLDLPRGSLIVALIIGRENENPSIDRLD